MARSPEASTMCRARGPEQAVRVRARREMAKREVMRGVFMVVLRSRGRCLGWG